MNEINATFVNDLQKLIGLECWGFSGGQGSIISIDFGDKIPRGLPVDNENLSEDVRNFDSEFSLFVNCVWRVESNDAVLFGAWTEHEIVDSESKKLIGQKVESIEIIEPAFDLIVTFSNDLRLKIFCDQTNEEDINDNYNYFTPKIIYVVGHKSFLHIEEYK